MKRGDAAISIYGCLHAAFFLIASHHEAQSPRPRIRSCLGGWSISSRRSGGANIMQAAVCLLFCGPAVGAFGRGDGRPDGAARNHCRIIKTGRATNYWWG